MVIKTHCHRKKAWQGREVLVGRAKSEQEAEKENQICEKLPVSSVELQCPACSTNPVQQGDPLFLLRDGKKGWAGLEWGWQS